jgi:hypothetical protein
VTCWDCLEHTPEPRLFAERLVALAKPGGTILLTTLNRQSLAFRLLGTNWSMVQPDHFTYWNPTALRRLFKSLGWTAFEWETVGVGRDFFRWMDQIQRLARRVSSPAIRSALPRTERRSGWDVHPGVLTIERAVTRVLSVADAGVDISCQVRRSSRPAVEARRAERTDIDARSQGTDTGRGQSGAIADL